MTTPTKPSQPNSDLWNITDDNEKFTTDEVFAYVKGEVARSRTEVYEVEVGIGTDSQMIGRFFRFVTVVCVYRKGKGGFYFYRPESIPRTEYRDKPAKLRMFDEVGKSIELAMALQEATGVLPAIHIDASTQDKGEFTSGFSEQLKGYVTGMGYKCFLKPESYIACGLADQHSKSKSARKDRRRAKSAMMRQTASAMSN